MSWDKSSDLRIVLAPQFFAIFNIFLVALFMRFLTWVYKNKILGEDSVSHAFYTQSLIVLYFLSQTHIRDCLWSS